MKKLLLITLIALGVLLTSFTFAIDVLTDNGAVLFSEVSGFPYIDANGRSMFPLSAVAKNLNAEVSWSPLTKTISLRKGLDEIQVPIGKKHFYFNNQLIQNDSAAVIKDGRTYVPIASIVKKFKYTVEWDGSTKSLFILSESKSSEIINSTHGWAEYNNSDPVKLLVEILNGNVIYKNGKYYATPEFYAMMANEKIVYNNDISGGTPLDDRYATANLLDNSKDWIHVNDLQQYNLSMIKGFVDQGNYKPETWVIVKGSTAVSKTYQLTDIVATDKSIIVPGVYNGITFNIVNNDLYLKKSDLAMLGLID